MRIDRKTFLRLTGLSLLGLAGKKVAGSFATAFQGRTSTVAGGLTAKRWAMVIDPHKCLREGGCTDCIAACNRVHNIPQFNDHAHEIKWIWKTPYEEACPSQENIYTETEVKEKPFLVFCNHCAEPPCVRVCPTQATWKREDGVVMMDWHRCIGCRYCMAACPYGSRSFNWLDPRPHIPQLDPDFPTRTKGVVEKCTFCEERLAKGQPPACVEACREKALVFGDLEDPNSEVRELLRTHFTLRRKPELGTQPEIYYIV
jgi:Fe-S-cluster-containing dehydrogenase component